MTEAEVIITRQALDRLTRLIVLLKKIRRHSTQQSIVTWIDLEFGEEP